MSTIASPGPLQGASRVALPEAIASADASYALQIVERICAGKVKAAFLGVATDGGSFGKAGIPATTLLPFKVPQQLVAFYHQKSDRPEVLSMDALANVLKLAFEWIRGGAS